MCWKCKYVAGSAWSLFVWSLPRAEVRQSVQQLNASRNSHTLIQLVKDIIAALSPPELQRAVEQCLKVAPSFAFTDSPIHEIYIFRAGMLAVSSFKEAGSLLLLAAALKFKYDQMPLPADIKSMVGIDINLFICPGPDTCPSLAINDPEALPGLGFKTAVKAGMDPFNACCAGSTHMKVSVGMDAEEEPQFMAKKATFAKYITNTSSRGDLFCSAYNISMGTEGTLIVYSPAEHPALQAKLICWNCRKLLDQCSDKQGGLHGCPICKVAGYCDRACQKKDWKVHKSLCSALKECTHKEGPDLMYAYFKCRDGSLDDFENHFEEGDHPSSQFYKCLEELQESHSIPKSLARNEDHVSKNEHSPRENESCCDEEEMDKLCSDEVRRDSLHGIRICREVGGTIFHARVEWIDVVPATSERLYLIRYDDGDCEHLTEVEVRRCAWDMISAASTSSTANMLSRPRARRRNTNRRR